MTLLTIPGAIAAMITRRLIFAVTDIALDIADRLSRFDPFDQTEQARLRWDQETGDGLATAARRNGHLTDVSHYADD
jgi:hypothetical protein